MSDFEEGHFKFHYSEELDIDKMMNFSTFQL